MRLSKILCLSFIFTILCTAQASTRTHAYNHNKPVAPWLIQLNHLQNYVSKGKLNLNSSAIKDADVDAIIAFLYHHPEITSLNLNYANALTPVAYMKLAAVKTLHELEIAKSITTCHHDVCNDLRAEHIEPFVKNSSLQKLNLWGNRIEDVGAIALAKNKSLRNIDLGHNKITDAGALALLTQLPNLEELDLLLANRITVETAKAIANAPYLKKIILSPLNGDEFARIISKNSHLIDVEIFTIGNSGAEALASIKTLKKLTIVDTFFDEMGAKLLAASPSIENLFLVDYATEKKAKHLTDNVMAQFGNNRTIKSLRIYYSGLSPVGVKILLRNTTLVALEFYDIAAGDAIAKVVADNAPSLKALSIIEGNLTATGANSLTTMSNLQELDISINNIGDDAAENLSKMPNLKNLNLFLTNLHDKGALELAQTKSIETLDVSANEISSAAILFLKRNHHITKLYY